MADILHPFILEADCENIADADAELQPSFATADFHAGAARSVHIVFAVGSFQ